MSTSPEFLTFAGASVLVLALGGALTVLSYLAYRREEKRSLWVAGFGFGMITTAGLIAAIYEGGVRQTYFVSNRELLSLHATQAIVLALGFLALIYSLTRY